MSKQTTGRLPFFGAALLKRRIFLHLLTAETKASCKCGIAVRACPSNVGAIHMAIIASCPTSGKPYPDRLA
jgi:hypothetical protein